MRRFLLGLIVGILCAGGVAAAAIKDLIIPPNQSVVVSTPVGTAGVSRIKFPAIALQCFYAHINGQGNSLACGHLPHARYTVTFYRHRFSVWDGSAGANIYNSPREP